LFFCFVFFFFQAEDGIRDFHVTGVQTCALPIYQAEPSMQPGHGLAEAAEHRLVLLQTSERCTSEATSDSSPPAASSSSHARHGRRAAIAHRNTARNASTPSRLARNSASWKPIPAANIRLAPAATKPQAKA